MIGTLGSKGAQACLNKGPTAGEVVVIGLSTKIQLSSPSFKYIGNTTFGEFSLLPSPSPSLRVCSRWWFLLSRKTSDSKSEPFGIPIADIDIAKCQVPSFIEFSYVPWSKVAILGMVIQPLMGNPYNGYMNPYYWVDDHPLLYGNNGSLDPGTYTNSHYMLLPPQVFRIQIF